MLSLSQLFIYPVKSMQGLSPEFSSITESGPLHDHEFMVTETDGTFLTARQYPQPLRFRTQLLDGGIRLSAPDGDTISIAYSDFTHSHSSSTEVWGTHFSAMIAPAHINQWISGYLQREVELRWTGTSPARRVNTHPGITLSFADSFPFLLMTEASFDYLQQRCPAALSIEQFRPNILLAGGVPFAEDSWQTIQIGEVRFAVVAPCSRCILINMDATSGDKEPHNKPLRTLEQFRRTEHGEVDFGVNLLALNNGIIRQGDPVTVLSTQTPTVYTEQAVEGFSQPQQQKKKLTIRYREQTFYGDNQTILLEQLEQQGIHIPYSCRAGLCGTCRLHLRKGDVAPLRCSTVKGNGSILSCSCIPQTDIEID